MPRRPRVATAGLTFHVMNRAARRLPLFECAGDYAAFERVLVDAVGRSDISLFAYCLMPNHWHLLLSPIRDGELSRFMHWLTMTHARRWQLARHADGQGAVYQGRFRAVPVTSDDHFLCVCRYVERNPLRAMLVDRAEAWKWSSLWRRCGNGEAKWLAPWPVTEPIDWRDVVNVPQTNAELDACRHGTLEKRRPRRSAGFEIRNDSRPHYT